MKADKIRELDGKEIETQLKEAGEKLFRLKFQLKMGQAEGVKNYRELRKDRARMLTELSARKAAGSTPAAAPAKPATAKPAAAKAAKAKPAPAKAAKKESK
ncbi:MAG: 50S ribosomal protein L29 [Bryobacteraceae bacterium]|nr:50S ribosomal protein L29 [Bryobacteraceae bacterium]